MSSLTEALKREIGQHFVFGFHGHELDENIKTLICDYHVGNIILMKRNVQSIKQVRGLVCDLQQLAKNSGHLRPLMIGIDQENGLVSAFSSTATYEAGTQFPGAMALAATGSPELTQKVSAATGRELRAAGINWAYSPVADVNSDPRNPVIGVRSFGDDPTEVGQYAKAVNSGLTSARVAPCAKHFPGHGDTHVDSHLALPRILKDKQVILSTEIFPFRALIDDDIATIMTGHMALPLVVGDDTPCSLSRVITTDLLRVELDYGGIIVTDCLEMEAVAETYGSEGGAVMSLVAGADVVMICHTMARQRGAVEETYKAVESGRISVEELRRSAHRIERFKDRFAGTWEEVLGRTIDDKELESMTRHNNQLAAEAYAASIALVSDASGFRPIGKGGKVLVFTPEMESLNKAVDDAEGVLRTDGSGRVKNTAGPSYLAFAASVRQRASSAEHIVYSRSRGMSAEDEESIRSASAIIFTTRNADQSTWQISRLRGVLEKLGSSGKQLVILASCAPYDLLHVGDVDAPYIACFEFTPPALEAAASVIFGEKKAQGRVPVLKGNVL